MKKRIIYTVIGLFAVVLFLVGIKGLQIGALVKMGKTMGPPPSSISSFAVKADQWQNTLSSIGSLEAAKGLTITADLPGRIAKINFKAGDQVKSGDLLIQQDVAAERAQLRSAQASTVLAKNNLARIDELYQNKVVSQSEFDNAQSAYRSAKASLDNIRATIEKKSIRAPFDGKLGIRLVNKGQSISAGQPVVSLQASKQMFVNFFLPQQVLSKIESGLNVSVETDAVPGQVFTGKINAIDPQIDEATRSIRVQAILANPEGKLLTGMFATIKVILPEKEKVLLVPQTAIQYATYGDSVFIIEAKKADKNEAGKESSKAKENEEKAEASGEKTEALVVRQQFVKLGKKRGDFVDITKGLEAGQLVASAGIFKLRNGAGVVINNSVKPNYSLTPVIENE